MIWRRSPPFYDAIASPGVSVNREIMVDYERNIDVNVPRSPAGKPIDRVLHHTQQTYYSRVRRYNIWKPLLQPIIATEIDAKKITISGE